MAPRRLRHPKLLPFFFPLLPSVSLCARSRFTLVLSRAFPTRNEMQSSAHEMHGCAPLWCIVYTITSLLQFLGKRLRLLSFPFFSPFIYFNVVSCCLLLTTPRSHLSLTDVGFALRSAGWLVRMGCAPSGPLFVANLKAIHSKM